MQFFCSKIRIFAIQTAKITIMYNYRQMYKKKYFLIFLIDFILVTGFSFASFASEIVQFQQAEDKETIVINVPDLTNRKIFTVNNPDRLVIDVPSLAGKHNISLDENYGGKLIKSARFAQFNPKTSRFVFDLTQEIRIDSIKTVNKRLLVAISDKASSPEKNGKRNTKSKIYKIHKSDLPPLIVIDAGHGGVDPGTIGDDGTHEKDVVLWYARALANKLLGIKKYRVLLTRSDDNFIMLRKRVDIARKAGASLFISIHADSSDEDAARGLSIYTVSEKASDKEAEALAARENKSDIIGGMDLSDERPDVADILISLAQRETKNNSATFADLLVDSLSDRVRMLPNSHRFAGFAVLKAPDIPSVLIEIGFLSHPQEEKILKSKPYRDKVVDGITVGIESYFRKKSSSGMN